MIKNGALRVSSFCLFTLSAEEASSLRNWQNCSAGWWHWNSENDKSSSFGRSRSKKYSHKPRNCSSLFRYWGWFMATRMTHTISLLPDPMHYLTIHYYHYFHSGLESQVGAINRPTFPPIFPIVPEPNLWYLLSQGLIWARNRYFDREAQYAFRSHDAAATFIRTHKRRKYNLNSLGARHHSRFIRQILLGKLLLVKKMWYLKVSQKINGLEIVE